MRTELQPYTGWRLALGWLVIAIVIGVFAVGVGQCHADMRERFWWAR